MPNICSFRIKIVGTKKDRETFILRMNDYEQPDHFWRIFDTYVEEDENSSVIDGDCAWSLESCCRASGYSEGVDLFAVNTRDLNLTLEAYSEELGMEFSEHYLYDHGECLINECVELIEYFYDETEYSSFEDFKEDYGLPGELKVSDLYDGLYYREGGFGSWDFCI